MKKTRIIAALLAVLILAGVVPTASYAASEPTITVSSPEGHPGDEVTVTVTMARNPGVCAGRLAIKYGEYLELTGADDGGTLSGPFFGTNRSANPYYVAWENSLATANNTKNGTLVTLKFKIKDGAPTGEQPVEASYLPGDFVNVRLENVTFSVVNGSVNVKEPHVHSFTNYISDGNATCTADGTKTAICDNGCGMTDTIPDPGSALGHLFTTYVPDGNATCTEDGTKTASCARGCGATDTVADPGSALGHSFTDYEYNGDATYQSDGTETAFCDRGCGATDTKDAAGTKLTDSVEPYAAIRLGSLVWESVTPDSTPPIYRNEAVRLSIMATDSESGVASVSYIVTGQFPDPDSLSSLEGWTNDRYVSLEEGGEYVVVARVTDNAGNVSYVTTPVIILNYTLPTVRGVENGGAYCVSAEIEVDENDVGSVVLNGEPVTPVDGVIPVVPTEEGKNEYSLSIADFAGNVLTIRFTVWSDHSFGTYKPNNDATCTEDGTKTASCIHHCGATDTVTDEGSALGHDFRRYVKDGNATCTEDGTKTAVCARGCGATDTVRDEGTALGHVFRNYVKDGNATCTEDGTKTAVCARGCGATDTVTDEGSALGHDFRKYDKDGNATCTEDGTKTSVCAHGCGATDTVADPGSALGHDWGEWETVKEPTISETGEARRICRHDPTHVETKTLDKKPAPFKDVDPGAYYAEPVNWAVANGITSGTSKTTFSPDDGCTRGQVVTFLWRSVGSPEPTSTKNKFTDVKSEDYYFKAVLWAVEQGITLGTSADKFSPNDTCTRGQVVTFLWRSVGSPAPKSSSHSFRDVKASDYFLNPVLWAVENNVTKGTSNTTFSPNDKCTRAHVVTFLKRSTDATTVKAATPNDGLVLGTDSAFLPLSGGSDSSSTTFKAVMDTVVEGMRNLSNRIDITEYGYSPEEFRPVFQEIINTVPDLFYIGETYSFYTSSATGKITYVVPGYSIDDPERIAAMKAEYEAELDRICALADTSWSDLKIALFFHDYIATRFEYDMTYTVRNVYSFFKEGHGVCQAYTLLYIALLERFGITVDAVISTDMNHTWNRVKIDNKWYHVDVTWDDPVPDRLGMVSHTYFLVSDSFIASSTDTRRPHYNWVGYLNPGVVCSDTSYDESIWTNVISPFVPIGGVWYFIGAASSGYAIMKTTNLKTFSSVKALPDKWGTGAAGYYWEGCYSGLEKFNDTLIYNTPRDIVSYNPVTGTTVTLFSLPSGGNDIYGVTLRDVLYYAVQVKPNAAHDYVRSISLGVRGDVDADGLIVMKDLVILKRYINGSSLEVNSMGADADGNGTINNADATALKAYLAGN